MAGPRNYFRESLMMNFLRPFKKRGKILDAGCGSGSLSIRLGKKGYIVSSVDLATKSLHYLRKKTTLLGLDKVITPRLGSILKLPYKNATFDAVVCGEVLEHLTNDTKAINELFRVLKKGGVAVISTPAHPQNWDISDEISGHERRYTKEGIERKFSHAGFQIIHCHYVGFPLNNLWHKYVFVPFLSGKMKGKKNLTKDHSIGASLVKSDILQKIFSAIFYFDILFNFTRKGNILFLIAKKI